MTEEDQELGAISELREAEQILWQFMRAYYKIKNVRENMERKS